MTNLKSIIKVFLLVLTWNLVCTLPAYADECELSSHQAGVLYFSYSYGQPYDYGYTMAAIAMEESNLGQWNINLQDPSASPWGVTLDKGLTALGWRDTPFNRNRVAQRMMDDHFLSARLAMEAIMYWHQQFEGDWRRVVKSYNGGWAGSEAYLVKIAANIEKIRRCEWIEGIKTLDVPLR